MAAQDVPHRCMRCSQIFSHKSSLLRHLQRCGRNLKAKSRQKSCQHCAKAKSRCDLQRPSCGRCQSRSLECDFESRNDAGLQPQFDSTRSPINESEPVQDVSSVSTLTPMDDGSPTAATSVSRLNTPQSDLQTTLGTLKDVPADIAPELVQSKQRGQIILGKAHCTPSSDKVARHTLFFIIRVLRSWACMMAAQHTSRFPPIIHHLQLKHGLPVPLAYCYTLVKMWSSQEEGSAELVNKTIIQEVKRVLREHASFAEPDLLAATQSLLILMVILFFGNDKAPAISHPQDAQMIIAMWDVKHHLSSKGMFLDQEINHTLPVWNEWAMVSAKRRTILALHHLEWAWSLLHGYPPLLCLELGPLPAPAAGYLWRETDENQWRHHYSQWLFQWKGGSYKQGELFTIKPGGNLDARSEMWLAEVDEFGMMLMSEVNAVSNVE